MYIFFFCYNLVSLDKGYSFIFESLVSKIWLDSLPKCSIFGYSLHIEIIAEILLRFSQELNTKIPLYFMGKEISGTIIFPVFIKKASPSHNRFSELFTHEERLVTSNMFFLYRGMNFEDFRGNVFELNFSNSPGITFLRDNS